MNDLSNISSTPAIVVVEGHTATARKLTIITNACAITAMALTGEKGKVGKVAGQRVGQHGMTGIISAACTGVYLPLAQYLAAITGKSVSIKNRPAFESLEGVFESAIADEKARKAGGLTKKGAPSANLAALTRALATVEGVQAAVAAFYADRKAAAVEAPAVVS